MGGWFKTKRSHAVEMPPLIGGERLFRICRQGKKMKVKKIWVRRKHLIPQLQPGIDAELEKQLRILRKQVLGLLLRNRFVSFIKQPKIFFDNQLNCIWLLHGFQAQPDEMFKQVSRLQIHTFHHWEIPTVAELQSIAQDPLFAVDPMVKDAKVDGENGASSQDSKRASHARYAGKRRVYASSLGQNQPGYQTVTMGSGEVGVSEESLALAPLHRISQRDIYSFVVAHGLLPKGVPGIREKLSQLYKITMALNSKQADLTTPSLPALKQHLLEGDFVRACLPVLEEAYLHDTEKGLWELHQPNLQDSRKPVGKDWVEVALDEPWEARDPERDVRRGTVAIDFGTSSTVVACREHGKTILLRVGMTDFFRKPRPEDYQNPTVMEFIHLPNLISAWGSEAYRPFVRWDDFRCSHAALASYQQNDADQRIVGGILTHIKQWPLLEKINRQPLRIIDQSTGTEMEIQPSSPAMPAHGQRLSVTSHDPFDPTELYAYYLGLFINGRSNGLFLDYYMTFPVTYPKHVKQRILASFARGLMRSLPPSLMDSPTIQRFVVREEASEPAAYAACALMELEIQPTPKGTAFAVFDFGGGSTDFDFGIYRLPFPQEEEQGYEQVINHFGASGDIYLGGENLVSRIVFLAFTQNLDICREHRIPFTCPPEAELFPGYEMFVDRSNIAQTNSALLLARVRHLWEDFQWHLPIKETSTDEDGSKQTEQTHATSFRRRSDLVGDALGQAIIDSDFTLAEDTQSFSESDHNVKIPLELLNRSREKVLVMFTVDRNLVNQFLVKRVGKGVYQFFIAMQQAFFRQGYMPEEVHILQAGNASRALLVQALFSMLLQNKMFRWSPPSEGLVKNPVLDKIREAIPLLGGAETDGRFIVHRPPVGDPNDPYRPTAKTGVAIGLLKLIPGETLLAIHTTGKNRRYEKDGSALISEESGESPFHFYVGRLKQGCFKPVLLQNDDYGEWRELGTPTRRAFTLVYSKSPQAVLGELPRGSSELREKALTFGMGTENKRMFIRAVAPTIVEICLADALEQVIECMQNGQANELLEQKVIDLF